jgi:hypothetical protein
MNTHEAVEPAAPQHDTSAADNADREEDEMLENPAASIVNSIGWEAGDGETGDVEDLCGLVEGIAHPEQHAQPQ